MGPSLTSLDPSFAAGLSGRACDEFITDWGIDVGGDTLDDGWYGGVGRGGVGNGYLVQGVKI